MTFDTDDPLSEIPTNDTVSTKDSNHTSGEVDSRNLGVALTSTPSQPPLQLPKPQQQLSKLQVEEDYVVPSMEELVDGCCLNSINGQQNGNENGPGYNQEGFQNDGNENGNENATSTSMVATLTSFKEPLTPENFKNFIVKSHCEENLQFLIEIYKYEYIWNQLFKRRSSILKCKKITPKNYKQKPTLNGNVSSNSNAKSVQRVHEDIPEHGELDGTSSACVSIQNIDLSTSLDELSSFVNLNLSSNTTSSSNLGGNWNDFDKIPSNDVATNNSTSTINTLTTNASNTTVATSSRLNSQLNHHNDHHDHHHLQGHGLTLICLCNNELKEDADPQVGQNLISQWSKIIEVYIEENSLNQINLPSEIYKSILRESQNSDILYHSPEILIELKNFILQLLRSNIYEEFLSYYDMKNTKNVSSATTLQSQFDSYSKRSQVQLSLPSLLPSMLPSPVPSPLSLAQPSLPLQHTLANILPLVKSQTCQDEFALLSTRGPCNTRTTAESIGFSNPPPKHAFTHPQPNSASTSKLLHHHNLHLRGVRSGFHDALHRVKSHGDEASLESYHTDSSGSEAPRKGWVKKFLKH